MLAILTDKLRSATLVMIRTKIVQLLRKIIANHDVDCTFIAAEVMTCLNDAGKIVSDTKKHIWQIIYYFIAFLSST